MKIFTEGDYDSVLRSKNKPRNPQRLLRGQESDPEVFLLDFFPCDQYAIKRHHQDYFGEAKTSSDSDDEGSESNSDEMEERENAICQTDSQFMVRVFGLLQLNSINPDEEPKYYSISLDLMNFKPFFYVKVPEHWNEYELNNFSNDLNILGEGESWRYKNSLIDARLVKRKPFYYFTGNDQFQYAKLTFNSMSAFKFFHRLLEKPVNNVKYERMESNIEPMLRLIHIKDLTPSGWIKIPREYLTSEVFPVVKTSDCQIHLRLDYGQIEPVNDKNQIPPLIYASYDIEANSSHGDFPLAKKTYQKLAQDIMTEYLKQAPKYLTKKTLTSPIIRQMIRKWLELAFHQYYFNPNISQCITEHNTGPNPIQKLLIIKVLEALGPKFHELLKPKNVNKEKPDELNESDEQAIRLMIEELHDNLEIHFPLLDLKKSSSHYGLLAEQLLREYHRMCLTKNLIFQSESRKMMSFWIDLAFDDIYNNHTIHWVETKYGKKPSPEVLDNLLPQLEYICSQAYYYTVVAKTIPKKVKRPIKPAQPRKHKPPQKGQRKMSSFFKNKSTKKPEPKPQESKQPEPEPEPDRKPWETEEEEEIYFPYGRYKKELPDRKSRDFFVKWQEDLLNEYLPPIRGDEVIQIGTTYKRYGDQELFLKHIITLRTCEQFTNYDLIEDENQDIYYNKLKDAKSEAKKLKIENPSGDLKTLNHQILMARKERQHGNDHSVIRIECYDTEREVLLAWKRLIKDSDPDILIGYNIFGFDFDFLWKRAEETNCVERFRDLGRIKYMPERFKEQKLASSGLGENYLKYIPMTGRVIIDLFKVVQTGGYRLPFYKLDYVCQVFLSKRKNDLPPQQIFIHQKGSDRDRAVIAKYCLIDCILCNRLIDRLDIITNNIGMSQVCTVPLSYLFLRGQGIKILSLVAKICRQEGYLIRTKERVLKSEKFEGAIVLDPVKNIYFSPSVVADFNSLYPSCMIAENLSQDSFVEIGGPYDNLPNTEYVDIEYDLYEDRELPGRKTTQKVKVGVKRCRFYQPPDGKKSLLPRILMKLLKARKDTRKEQKKFAKGTFEWSVKEGLQLAYKVTANSLYGQVGAMTSPIFLKEIAACTTASGRKLIYFTKDFILKNYDKSEVIYGDTDSVFAAFDCRNSRGEKLHGLDGVFKSIELCVETALAISRQLKPPHNLEFEKAIFPFMLLSKKRYHGHYYTSYAIASYFAKSMGIVLKRRDNAEIVKYVFGGILKVIMEEHDIKKAMEVGKRMFKEVLEGNFPLDMFIITKSLKSYYKNPDQIAHNVLAQRIGERDPGNKPQSNDRLAYAYIKVPAPKKGEKLLQGNRIETPEFIREHDLEIDYKFYLTNQIMKPVSQIFELVMPDVTELFVDALMDYERKQTGIQRMSKWALPNSDEYRIRVKRELQEILAAQEEEAISAPKSGDEVLSYGDPLDTAEY